MKWKGLLYGIAGSLILTSAAWKPAPIPTNFKENFTLEDKKLSVSARVYSGQESKQVLNVNLIDKGYVPVEVTIQNQGDHAYAISLASTALRSERPKDVAWIVP
jgi:hypothetical protein